MPRTTTALKKPTPTSNYKLLGKRDSADREMFIFLLETERNMPAQRREMFAAMMFLDWSKMSEDHQRRFAAIMEKGNPDERRRIGCLVESTKK